MFDHTAQLTDVIQRQNQIQTVLVLQTDAGADHSLKRLQTKLALIRAFKVLDLDRFLVIRCAPNGLAYNKVERCMSQLNIGLSNVSTKRSKIPKWAEDAIKNCGGMNDIRQKDKVMKELQLKVAARLSELDKIDHDQAVRRALECVTNNFNAEDASNSKDASTLKVVDQLMNYLGASASAVARRGAVSGVIDMLDDGVELTHNTSLSRSIANARRDKATEFVSRDFRSEWNKSINDPIRALESRIARLAVDGRPVCVHPRFGSAHEEKLHAELLKIDKEYKEEYNLVEDA